MRAVKGHIPWVGKVKRKRVGRNWDSCRGILMGCGISELWGDNERHTFSCGSLALD